MSQSITIEERRSFFNNLVTLFAYMPSSDRAQMRLWYHGWHKNLAIAKQSCELLAVDEKSLLQWDTGGAAVLKGSVIDKITIMAAAVSVSGSEVPGRVSQPHC